MILLSVVSNIVFGGGSLYVWRLNRLDQRSTHTRIKEEMLMAEQMRAKQEAEQAGA